MIEFESAVFGLRGELGRSGTFVSHSSRSALNFTAQGSSSSCNVLRRALGMLLYNSQHDCKIDLLASQSGGVGPCSAISSSLFVMLMLIP